MILVLDANILMQTPFHRPSWHLLGARADSWGIEVLIPRVSALEAIGDEVRKVGALRAALRKQDRRNASPELQAAIAELGRRAGGLEKQFEIEAAALGARLIDPVDVDPLEVVRRQVARRKPCKEETGDGYRDTLNWLTVLDIAERHPDQDIVWVSADGDFGRKTLHPELVEEAQERGLADRITLEKSLADLVRQRMAQDGLPDEQAAFDHVVAVQDYVRDTLLPDWIGHSDIVFPDRVAVKLGDRTPVGDDGAAVWSFSTYVLTNPEPDPEVAGASGLVMVDHLGRPLEGELTDPTLENIVTSLGLDADRIIRATDMSSLFEDDALMVWVRWLRETYKADSLRAALARHGDEDPLNKAVDALKEASRTATAEQLRAAGLKRVSGPPPEPGENQDRQEHPTEQ